MKILILFVGWCILFVLSAPIALLAAVLLPVIWILSIPIRVVIAVVHGVLALLRAILLLPARLLGGRSHH